MIDKVKDRLPDIELKRKLEEYDDIYERQKFQQAGRTTITFTSAHNTEDLSVRHKLGKIPTDIIVGIPSANAVVRKGVHLWTENHIYLRCSAACTVTIYPVL